MVSIANDLVEELLVRYLAQLFKRRQVRLTVSTADTATQERIYALPVGRTGEAHQVLDAYSNLATTTD